MEFDYTVTTSKKFDDAVQSVQDEIGKAGMRVLYVHDVQKTLVDKGFERAPFKIVEFCNAAYANEVLNTDSRIGLCLPCKINVYAEDSEIRISGMRPTMLVHFFPTAKKVEHLLEEIDQKIQSIIAGAK